MYTNLNTLTLINSQYFLFITTAHSSFLNAHYMHLVTNVQLLKHLCSEISDLYSFTLAFSERFPMMYFITKASPIIIIDSLLQNCYYVNLLKMIRTCSTGYIGSIHVNTLGGRRMDIHSHAQL